MLIRAPQERADSAVVLPPGAPAFAYAEHNIQASYVPPGDWEPSPEALQEAHAMSQVMESEASTLASASYVDALVVGKSALQLTAQAAMTAAKYRPSHCKGNLPAQRQRSSLGTCSHDYRTPAQVHPMEMTDSESGDMPVGAGAPLVAPDGQVFVREVSGASSRWYGAAVTISLESLAMA